MVSLRSYSLDCSTFGSAVKNVCEPAIRDAPVGEEDFLAHCRQAGYVLPEALRRRLHQFRIRGSREGVLLLRNLPHEHTAAQSGDIFARTCLGIIASRLGHVIGYRQEKDGLLFQDIRPTRAHAQEQASDGSLVQLEFHTERCFHPYLPDYILLYCIRPDEERQGSTLFAGSRQIVQHLTDEVIGQLSKPQFRTGIDYSFGNITTEKANGPIMSVLHGSKEDPFLRYDRDLMVGLTGQAEEALAALSVAVDKAKRGVCLEAGDMLIIDNHRAVHGRAAFQPRYDGAERWLKRCYLVNDLGQSAVDREVGSRIINTLFH